MHHHVNVRSVSVSRTGGLSEIGLLGLRSQCSLPRYQDAMEAEMNRLQEELQEGMKEEKPRV